MYDGEVVEDKILKKNIYDDVKIEFFIKLMIVGLVVCFVLRNLLFRFRLLLFFIVL